MDLEQAKKLRPGNHIHHVVYKNADGTPCRYKVTSVKTWKTRPDEVMIGLKRGMREFYKITQDELQFYELGWS